MSNTLTIGFTESDRAADYCPMMDGWRPGARQRELTIAAPAGSHDIETIAEAVYTATNAPSEIIAADPLANEMAELLVDAIADGARVRSLSVGDTITGLDKDGSRVQVSCEPRGWARWLG